MVEVNSADNVGYRVESYKRTIVEEGRSIVARLKDTLNTEFVPGRSKSV